MKKEFLTKHVKTKGMFVCGSKLFSLKCIFTLLPSCIVCIESWLYSMEIIKTKSHGIIYLFFSEHQTAAEAMQLRKDMAAASKSSISKNEAAVKAAYCSIDVNIIR